MKREIVKRYFHLMEQFKTDESDFNEILHPDILQTEFPNRLTEQLTVSDWKTLFARMPVGKTLLKEQTYDIQNVIENEQTIVTEVIWTATIANDIGQFHSGQQLKAYFCCVFEFKDGTIYRQRNYDCFEKF